MGVEHSVQNLKAENKVEKEVSIKVEEPLKPSTILGYFIYIGRTSCRLYKIEGDQLKSEGHEPISYDDRDTFHSDIDYLENMTEIISNRVKPLLNNKQDIFIKTYADQNFSQCFHNPKDRSWFWYEFYEKTGLCFNILEPDQVKKNLGHIFSSLDDNDVVINIGRSYVDIYVRKEVDFEIIHLDIGLKIIENYIEEKGFGENWYDIEIKEIKKHVKDMIGDKINISAVNAYILKDELTFMQKAGYPLEDDVHQDKFLSFSAYRAYNKKSVFRVDFKKFWMEKYPGDIDRIDYWGMFKIGHIVLEAIFEKMGISNIYPSNYHCLHGDANAYVFNIVVGGSYTQGNMAKAIKLLQKMGATITSPKLNMDKNQLLEPPSVDTDIEHSIALEGCDLLFVSNDNAEAYFGPTTAMQIYAARVLHKPIAYWKKPPEEITDKYHIRFIPYECWEKKMDAVIKKEENGIE